MNENVEEKKGEKENSKTISLAYGMMNDFAYDAYGMKNVFVLTRRTKGIFFAAN